MAAAAPGVRPPTPPSCHAARASTKCIFVICPLSFQSCSCFAALYAGPCVWQHVMCVCVCVRECARMLVGLSRSQSRSGWWVCVCVSNWVQGCGCEHLIYGLSMSSLTAWHASSVMCACVCAPATSSLSFSFFLLSFLARLKNCWPASPSVFAYAWFVACGARGWKVAGQRSLHVC
jgi:hypothetical protein